MAKCSFVLCRYAYSATIFTLALIFGMMDAMATSSPFENLDLFILAQQTGSSSDPAQEGAAVSSAATGVSEGTRWPIPIRSMFLLATLVFLFKYGADKWCFLRRQFCNTHELDATHIEVGRVERQSLRFLYVALVSVLTVLTLVFLHFGAIFQKAQQFKGRTRTGVIII